MLQKQRVAGGESGIRTRGTLSMLIASCILSSASRQWQAYRRARQVAGSRRSANQNLSVSFGWSATEAIGSARAADECQRCIALRLSTSRSHVREIDRSYSTHHSTIARLSH